ncbi:hypothetical protein PZE06_16380 [Robertmurraya sp. DFI.2.37]|uniref:hypothetical protein n=1 Tax=unclassified Robertmurraya TaxID=2837524 RepID=UPI0012452D61|nr:hypothetical protein [Robertmurraya sp. DFI.2.37]MDF1509718.1 hypothetical protein [Robertmurraya sp. DFI.2.37]
MREIKFQFGDIIENGWASEDNPIRKGIFVRHKKKLIELTDGQGKFWEVYHDKDNKNVRIGNIYENPELLDS